MYAMYTLMQKKDRSVLFFFAIKKTVMHSYQHNCTRTDNDYDLIYAEEETSGEYGMQAFLRHKDFTNLNMGFTLDEGGVKY